MVAWYSMRSAPRCRGDCGAPAHSVYVGRELAALCAPAGMGEGGHYAGDELFVACRLIAVAVALAETPLRCRRDRPGVARPRSIAMGCQRRLNRALGTGPAWREPRRHPQSG